MPLISHISQAVQKAGIYCTPGIVQFNFEFKWRGEYVLECSLPPILLLLGVLAKVEGVRDSPELFAGYWCRLVLLVPASSATQAEETLPQSSECHEG